MKTKVYQILKFLLRLACAVAIIATLICLRKEQLKNCLQVFDCKLVIPAMLCYALHLAACAWRWQKLAVLQNFDISFKEAFSLTMQGSFFSLVLPGGAIGGDVIKMGILAKRSKKGNRVEGMFTVFMDRIVGMVALFALAIVLLLLFLEHIPDVRIAGREISRKQLWFFTAGIFLLCLSGIAAGIGIFFHSFFEKIKFIKKMMDFLDRRFNNVVSRAAAMADLYAKAPWQMIWLTIFSVLFIHLISVAVFFILLSGSDISLSGNLLLIPTAVTIGNIAGLIPVSPGGIGIRDLTVIAILSSGGITSGSGEISQLMSTGIMIFFSLIGGIFFIFDTGNKSTPAAGSSHE